MRTRFPPSPTGFLHVGGLRTALYNYILARQTKGTFVMRIEDTDQARSVEGAVENLLEGMHWAGIHPDEGVMMEKGKVVEKGQFGPYFQSKRLDLYKKYAQQLIDQGHAYYCFCTPERLDEMRKGQEARKQAPMYDRTCCKLSTDEVGAKLKEGVKHVIRMKVPHERTIKFTDDIRGDMTFMGHTVDDQVLLKGDGFPTYHLAHVVDDHLMEMDLVMRGEEWLSSLPKHLLLFEFLGWKPPRYAHVSLLLNADRTKLSKRQNSVSVQEYIAKGYLPETLVNFLALLGWNPGTTQEMFTMDELIAQFDLSRVQKAGAIFDLQKLDWLQGQWMRKFAVPEFAKRIQPYVAEKYSAAKNDSDFERRAGLIQERVTFFKEATEMMSFFYEKPKADRTLLSNEKQKVTDAMLPDVFAFMLPLLETIDEKQWTTEGLQAVMIPAIKEKGFKNGQILWPMRAALTGLPFSPGAFEVADGLGKKESMERLMEAKKLIS
jgi:glutamyl-tRNA synthetase